MKVRYTIIKQGWRRKPYKWVAHDIESVCIAKSDRRYSTKEKARGDIMLLKGFPEAPIDYLEDTKKQEVLQH